MQTDNRLWKRALTSGTVAGIATAIAAALAGRRETGSYAAPLNATSHVLWGDRAAMRNAASLKYTLTGFLLNHASAIFWAAVHEKFFGAGARTPASPLRSLAGSAAVTAGAYVTDYYLVPKRLTPGFEKRLSGNSLAAIYGVLALGLAAGSLLASSRKPQEMASKLKSAFRSADWAVVVPPTSRVLH